MFVKQSELRHELAIHILRRSVGTRHATPGDDERTDQARVDVAAFINVRVIEPERSAALAVVRPGPFRYRPGIGVSCTGGHCVIRLVAACGAVEIARSLRVFGIKDAMRMHTVGTCSVVIEDDLDRVADLSPNHGAKNTQVLPLLRPWL